MKLSVFIAGCFGIVGFILAILAGLYANNAFSAIITKALLASVACYLIGYAVGTMAQFVANEHALSLAKQVAEADAHEAARKREEAAAADAEAAALVLEATPAASLV